MTDGLKPIQRDAMSDLREVRKAIAAVPWVKQPATLAKHLAMMELLHCCDNSGGQPPPLTAQELRKIQAWMNMYIIQAFQLDSSKVLKAFDEAIDQGYWVDDGVTYARQYAQLLGVMLA